MTKRIAGLYRDLPVAHRVAQELVDHGIPAGDISLVAGANSASAANPLLEGLRGILAGLGSLAIPGVGPVVVAGPLISALEAGDDEPETDRLAAALAGMGIREEEITFYAEAIHWGYPLILVTAPDDRAGQVAGIMDRYAPLDVNQRIAMEQLAGYQPDPEDDLADDRPAAGPGDTRPATELPGRSIGTISADTATAVYGYDTDRTHSSDYGTGVTSYGSGATDLAADEPGDMTSAVNDFPSYETGFRRHYDSTFGGSGYDYERYLPAYRFGYRLARHDRYGRRAWADVEANAQRAWEAGRPNSWADFKEAIRHAWEQAGTAVK